MRIAVIACAIFTRQLCRAAAKSVNDCRVFFLDYANHRRPSCMPGEIQKIVDHIEEMNDENVACERISAIVLVYGLCCNGINGIKARNIPIIVPRADDCTAIFLGSQKRYLDLFNEYGGKAYWYNAAWYEQGNLPGKQYFEDCRKKLSDRYDEESADYVLETEYASLKEYRAAVYISDAEDKPQHIHQAEQDAEYMNWNFRVVPGDLSLLQCLLDGKWDDNVFQIVPPGHMLVPSYDERKVRSVLPPSEK